MSIQYGAGQIGQSIGGVTGMTGAEIAALISGIVGAAASTASAVGQGVTGTNPQAMLNLQSQYRQEDQAENLRRYELARSDSLNAYTNKVADLKRAGLSPILATGGPIAGPVVMPNQQSAPPIETSPMKLDFTALANSPSTIMSIMKMGADIHQTTAQTALTKTMEKKAESEKMLTDVKKAGELWNLLLGYQSNTPIGSVSMPEGVLRTIINTGVNQAKKIKEGLPVDSTGKLQFPWTKYTDKATETLMNLLR